MRIQITIILILIVSIGGLAWYAKYQNEQRVIAEASILEAHSAVAAWQAALEQQSARVDEQSQQLANSVHEYELLRRKTDRRIRHYETIIATSEADSDWSTARVPDVIALRLCEYTSNYDAGANRVSTDPETIYRPSQSACTDPDRYFTSGDVWRFTESLIEMIDRSNHDRAAIRNLFYK